MANQIMESMTNIFNILYLVDILLISMRNRSDRQKNKQLILDAMLRYYNTTHILPSQKMLAQMTGLSTRTIRRYRDDMLNADFFQEKRSMLLTLMDYIVMSLIFSAIKGNVSAIRMCFILAFDWDITKQTNYIKT